MGGDWNWKDNRDQGNTDMSEEATGAISGAAQGASAGATVGSVVPGIGTAVGAVVGGVIGGIGGFLGGRSAKKRRAAIQAQIAQLRAKVGESVRNRLREVDKLTDKQIKLAEDQMNMMLDYYAELKLNYQGMFERNAGAAEERYGKLVSEIEKNLGEELEIQGEVLDQYNADIDALYGEVRDFVQADIAHNNELKEEFRTTADKAIRDTFQASDDAKVDLQQLKDSGGRPEDFDRVVAENAKSFGDIQNQIDRSDAARGRSDLTGKKLTAKFAEAMAKGNIAGQMGEIGQRQEQALRGEITGLGQTAMQQEAAKLRGASTQDGQIMAGLAEKFKGQKIEAMLNAGMDRLSMEQDVNKRQLTAGQLYEDSMVELKNMLDKGLIDADQAAIMEEKLAGQIKMEAQVDNWNYKDKEAKSHEQSMLNTIASLQGQATAPKTDYVQMGKDIFGAASSIKGLMGGGGGGFNQTPAAGGGVGPQGANSFNYQGPQNSGGGGSWFSKLFGQSSDGMSSVGTTPYVNDGSTVPINPYDQRQLGRFQGYR